MITIDPFHDDEGRGFVVRYSEPAEGEQAGAVLSALPIFGERNAKYKDNWVRQGYRGPLYDLRRKVERIWDEFWNGSAGPESDLDDVRDAINYAGILMRALGRGDRDGAWW